LDIAGKLRDMVHFFKRAKILVFGSKAGFYPVRRIEKFGRE
jgi:hypothetical protein